MPSKSKLVVFDINHTLIEDDSWAKLNVALGMTVTEDEVLWSLNEEGLLSNEEWVAVVNRLYKKRGRPTRQKIETIVHSYSFLPGAKEVVEYVAQRGYTVALISGAMNLVVEHVAEALSVQHYKACSEFVFDDAGILDHFTYLDNDKQAKKTLFLELCQELEVDPSEAICVGDGANEEELFAIGKGITFEGSKLADQAWRVVPNLKGILEIL